MKKKRYENLDQVETVKSIKDIWKWQLERWGKKKDLSYVVPQCEKVELEKLQQNRNEMSITWIGHCTFLIQIAGLNIITDPVWAERMGFAKRLSGPGIPCKEIPKIDVVLISHNHYDHLHISSIKQLKGNPIILVPEGLAKYMRRKGFDRVEEFTWWQTTLIKGVECTFVPAQHWSRRSLWDTNRSWWGGWVLRDMNHSEESIYYAGDSGYFRGFQEIGKKYVIKYALLPIGAYEPEWFMSTQHVAPEEAVKAFKDTKATYFIPMHYGAFRLADETTKEALDRLEETWKSEQLDETRLKILKHGETLWDLK